MVVGHDLDAIKVYERERDAYQARVRELRTERAELNGDVA